MQLDDYVRQSRLRASSVKTVEDNPQYQFISRTRQGATKKYGVKSVSIVATKE